MAIPIPDWEPPFPARGDFDFVRVSSSHLSGRGCREKFAYACRPAVWPVEYIPAAPTAPADFPLGAARDAAALLLKDPSHALADPGSVIADVIDATLAASRQDWPEESLAMVASALSGYLRVLADLAASGELPTSIVFTDVVFADQEGPRTTEYFAWALHHYVDGGSLRETHILRLSNAAGVHLSDATVALAAHALGSGVIAEPKTKPKQWQAPFDAFAHQPPRAADRVRVRVIGMADASNDVRFDGTVADAKASFDRYVPSAVSVYSGGTFGASKYCTSCKIRQHCPGLGRLPGLLGVAGYSEVTRSLSPSDLWVHAACPRQLYLRGDLGIPGIRQADSPSQQRGRQIHEWLENAHRRGVGCTVSDLPDVEMSAHGVDLLDGGRIATELGWTHDEYVTNRRFLLQHLDVCPVRTAESDSLVVEWPMTAWDTEANVVVSSRPDATYVSAVTGRTVIRETKTADPRFLPPDERGLLEKFPQVALDICLLADGFDPLGVGGDGAAGLVELELLSAMHHSLVAFDAADSNTVLQARMALAERVDRWLFDDEHPVGDRPPCSRCPVAYACGRSVSGALPDAALDYLHGLAPDTEAADWAQSLGDETLAVAVGAIDQACDEDFPF